MSPGAAHCGPVRPTRHQVPASEPRQTARSAAADGEKYVSVGAETDTPCAARAALSGGKSRPRATHESVKVWMFAGRRCSSRSKIEKTTSSFLHSRSGGSEVPESSKRSQS